jgi:hypothetical protein
MPNGKKAGARRDQDRYQGNRPLAIAPTEQQHRDCEASRAETRLGQLVKASIFQSFVF